MSDAQPFHLVVETPQPALVAGTKWSLGTDTAGSIDGTKCMAHEFEEYRPYKAMAQFRREIGKYVNEKEVARLERYVTLE